MREQLDGEYSCPFELYRAAKDSIAPHFAADPKFVNRGIAPIVLPRLVSSVFELEPRCRRAMFDLDHRNNGARQICEYAGCTLHGEHDASNRPMAPSALTRSRSDVPDVG